MTRDDLITLVSGGLACQPEEAPGGVLICHTPQVAPLAYLGHVYDAADTSAVVTWFAQKPFAQEPYRGFLSSVANGLRFANFTLTGVIERIDRSGMGAGQPISLDYGNLFDRPNGLAEDDLVIGSLVGWSSKAEYVLQTNGRVRLVHNVRGTDVADEWPSFEAMLRAEVGRLLPLHDRQGIRLVPHTRLMHPAAQKWETEEEPGASLH